MYDSPNFDKQNVNPNHKYALQPIVLKSTNANGVSDYYNGLIPDYPITYQTSSGTEYEGEDLLNLGILGDVNEPFLAKAIALITGTTSKTSVSKTKNLIGFDFEKIADSKDFTPSGKKYVY